MFILVITSLINGTNMNTNPEKDIISPDNLKLSNYCPDNINEFISKILKI